jgi:2-polyprenyl-3-methyl-5-hydroxy-6-metoxy-1,4-benzoquinol methylase
MNKDKEIFEKTYEKPSAVWTTTEPPKELVKLIESGKIKPCKAIDIGCGEGFYSIYLASKGFDVLGVDISENAIKYAKENAASRGVNVRFIAMDIANMEQLKEKFDFVLEWAIMHHIMPPKSRKYIEDIRKILKKGGKYLSVCFNENDSDFGGPNKKYRMVSLGTKMPQIKLYFSSLDELKDLFKPHFRIIEAKLIQMLAGKPHIGNYFFMEKS